MNFYYNLFDIYKGTAAGDSLKGVMSYNPKNAISDFHK